MNINIDRSRIRNADVSSLREKCASALDSLWTESWIRDSISKADRHNLKSLKDVADHIAEQCDTALVVASGDVGRLIKAGASAMPAAEGRPEVHVFGSSLSPQVYSEEMINLEKEDFVLIGITESEESLETIAAFTTMKRFLIEKYGQSKAAERIYIMAGKASRILAEEASENDFHLMPYPENIPAQTGANSHAMLFPLAIKGIDIDRYLDGFEQMLASPQWDINGADYAVARSVYKQEDFLIWQKQLEEFGKWAADFEDGRDKKVRLMPERKAFDVGVFDTVIIAAEDREDIMTPFFDGCNDDGSLNLLLQEKALENFNAGKSENPGFKITLERLDEYNLGQLFAFVQLSNGITKFLLNN